MNTPDVKHLPLKIIHDLAHSADIQPAVYRQLSVQRDSYRPFFPGRSVPSAEQAYRPAKRNLR